MVVLANISSTHQQQASVQDRLSAQVCHPEPTIPTCRERSPELVSGSSNPVNRQLLIATRNVGKLRELSTLLADLPFRLLSLDDFPQLEGVDVDETGDSYQSNAKLKAVTYGSQAKVLTLAEDSGLEVTALNNFPGINSDRWLTGTYQQKNLALLAKIDSLGNNVDRSATFVNVTCLYDPANQSCQFFLGELLGTIAHNQSGSDGFGFDPIFIPHGYEQTLAELGQDIKNQISARAKAINKLKLTFSSIHSKT